MVSRNHDGNYGDYDPWTLDPELRYHIQHCPCSCDHMGYGNFLNYQVPPSPYQLPVHHPGQKPLPPYIRTNYYYDFDYTPSLSSCSCTSSPSPSLTDTTAAVARSTHCTTSWYLCLVLCVIVATIAAGLTLPFALHPIPPHTLPPTERLALIRHLLKHTPLIDGHNDLPWNLRQFLHNKLARLNLTAIASQPPWSTSRWSHTDLPRLRAGLVGAQFWSAYVPCRAQHRDAIQLALEQIDAIRRLVELNAHDLGLAHSALELTAIHKAGRIASLIGVEGGHALGGSLAVLRMFYALGARYVTVTHACDTTWASGANTKRHNGGGLSPFGRSVIREMNRLGMIVDLSHTSAKTAREALNASQAPVIFSHSNAAAICNSSRNVPDDVLRMVALNGGIVMVNFYALLVSCSGNATMRDVIGHINHVRDVAGVEHVGIGAGYDGINGTPTGLEHVGRYPYLLAELLADPVWTEDDVALLAGLNFLRVFGQVEAVRDQWRLADVLPGEESDFTVGDDANCRSIYS